MSKDKIFKLILEPDPILHKSSEIVKNIDQEIVHFSEKLISTMVHYNGLGLAAVQVGVLKKIIAVDFMEQEDVFQQTGLKGPTILINPEIIDVSRETKTYKEGCLSFGNIYPEVERANRVKIKYMNLKEEEKIVELSDTILSSCLQHEIDHTNGIVFLDKLSKIKKDFMKKKYLKWRKNRDFI
ncbi:MAG: peptide deformylase [Candidatus Midichloriaceae bacterium]|jgi:peptide deformylase